MQRFEVSGAVRLIYRSLGVKGLMDMSCQLHVPADLPSRKEPTVPTGRGSWGGGPRGGVKAFDDREPAVRAEI